MKTLLSTFCTFLALGLILPIAQSEIIFPVDLEGIYNFTAADAPYGYEKGTMDLKKVEGEWTATMNIAGQTFKGRDIKVEGNKITFSLYIEGTPVQIKLEHKKDVLTGVASTYEGDVKIKAERRKK